MAVTRTLAELAGDLRIGDGNTAPTGAVGKTLERIAASAKALVEAYAPDAPASLQNEAYVRLAGFLYDADPSGATPGGPNALKASGAASLLSAYRVRRGGLISGAAAATAAPAPGSADTSALEARIAALESALAGGSTGQVLAKASAADRVFAWIASAIQDGTVTLAALATAVANRLLPSPSGTDDAGKVAVVNAAGDGYGLAAQSAGGVAAEDAVPFAETFRDVYARTFAATLNGATQPNNAFVSDGNSVPSGAPSGTTDFVGVAWGASEADRDALDEVKAGDWMRAKVGDDYLIARIQYVERLATEKETNFWFNPSTDIADTLAYDQLGNGAGEIRFARDSRFLLADGANLSSDLIAQIQGTNEPKTFTGYTRVNALTGSGEWQWSGTDGDSLQIGMKASERTDIVARVKPGHYVRFGALEVEVGSPILTYLVGQVLVIQFNASKVAGSVPALNVVAVLKALGDDIHRSEVSTAALKDTLPDAGRFLKVDSDGTDVEGEAGKLLPVPGNPGNNNEVLYAHGGNVSYSKVLESFLSDLIPRDKGAWVASTSYVVGDIVSTGGKVYRCKTANSDATFTASKWDDLTAGGAASAETLTLIGAEGTLSSNEIVFNAATRTAFITAWNASTYKAFVVVITTGSPYFRQHIFRRTPLHTAIDTTGTGWQLLETWADANPSNDSVTDLCIEVIPAGGNARMKLSCASASHFSSGSKARIYGVS